MSEVRGQERTDVSAPAESELPFLGLFVLVSPSVDWVTPPCIGEGDLLYSVYCLKCQSLPEAPLQAHPETMPLGASLSPGKLTHKISHHSKGCYEAHLKKMV